MALLDQRLVKLQQQGKPIHSVLPYYPRGSVTDGPGGHFTFTTESEFVILYDDLSGGTPEPFPS